MLNQGWIYRDQVDRAAVGLTLLDYYSQRYRHSTPAEWQTRIIAGQIHLDGVVVPAETPLKQGQTLTYHRPPWEEPEVPLAFEVLHEDADVLVVAKPSGLPVLPGGGFLEHTLLRQLQRQYPQETPIPIHRLGRSTSGLLLLARSALAKASLSQQMRDRQIRKVYHTLAQGTGIPDRLEIHTPIGKVPHAVLGYVYGAVAAGLPASSLCQVLERRGDSTLLEVLILTGRPHQIRIHLAAAGYPLVGDPLYEVGGLPRLAPAIAPAKLPVPGDCGYFLHAVHLTFTHPRTHQSMSLICPPPLELRPIRKLDPLFYP
ncbi:RNA pseudouridine synthase [Leptolyngbya sp. 'hensonii']|uniref:RluA family pseudouridine synthase n=1 Tax=Leptolyngbya sp. 'hensonii' TaxID=1922337 RepID=UPI00094FD1D4|nr:RluA family pseudouridine synthase [Leptolyngbya sp. 'hensonii']OLP19185.1 RNA pseudouridine synthase [Leptolyngbya sp. 'hensonii']